MIYDGVFISRNIEDWLSNHIRKNINGNVLALEDDLFKFSEKYLLVDSYKEFINIRKQTLLNTNYNSGFLNKLKGKTIKPFLNLEFKEKSSEYLALIHFFSFLSHIIKEEEDANNKYCRANYYNKDSVCFDYEYSNFINKEHFINEKTFNLIKYYADDYFEWIKTELKENKKFIIKKKVESF
jgi:hypothetical protein